MSLPTTAPPMRPHPAATFVPPCVPVTCSPPWWRRPDKAGRKPWPPAPPRPGKGRRPPAGCNPSVEVATDAAGEQADPRGQPHVGADDGAADAPGDPIPVLHQGDVPADDVAAHPAGALGAADGKRRSCPSYLPPQRPVSSAPSKDRATSLPTHLPPMRPVSSPSA